MIEWFLSQRKKKISVNIKAVKEQAKIILKELSPGSYFRASNGWYEGFSKRFKISRRVGTHVAQNLSEDYIENIKKFFLEIKRFFIFIFS